MSSARHTWRLALLAPAAALVCGMFERDPLTKATWPTHDPLPVVGSVVDRQGAVSQARVRWKGSADSSLSDEHGRFRLRSTTHLPHATAWKEGYLIGGAKQRHGSLFIQLERLPDKDNASYEWVDPTPHAATEHCGNCHGAIYQQWRRGGHAQAATNPKFLQLYGDRDAARSSKHDWNLLAERPDGRAVCASCHAPTLEFDDPASEDLRHVGGVSAQGVHCDFCHKVRDVSTASIGLAHGRFGMQLLRPRDGQLFFGPLQDVDRGEDAYAPVFQESRYCSACHEGTVFGVHVYSTYSEWLASPAARQGKQCQHCHMRPDGQMTNIAPGHGGLERDAHTLASHELFPGGQQTMLQRSLRVAAHVIRQDEHVLCTVDVTAHDVGHRVPTGFIDRHLILGIEAYDADGRRVVQRSGPMLPTPAGDLAGSAGRLFARLRTDEQGAPAPFWRPAAEPVETRLVPEQPVRTVVTFALQATEIHIRLIYRRFWQAVSRAKHWPDEGIVVFDQRYPAD